MLKVINGGKEPTKGSKYSACIDLYANEDVVIGAGETVLVPLGVKIDKERLAYKAGIASNGHKHFYRTHQLNLHIRSSMSAKHGLIIANGTGIIDLDYPDEIKICLHNPITGITQNPKSHDEYYDHFTCNNSNNYVYTIKKGDKIAQISLVEHKSYLFGVESDNERIAGFGSTDA